MQSFKKILKKLIPSSLLKPFLPGFHFLQSLVANIKYGFPARKLKVIGVTGTNGKTTTAIMIAKILETAGHKVGLSTSAQFQIADKKWENDQNMTVVDPFALQKLLKQMKQAGVEWAVIEVTSHALSQHRILGIPIHTAVLTNLSPDHLDYHKSIQNYAAAKAKLIKKAKNCVVLNKDDGWFNFFQKQTKVKTITYGTEKSADVVLSKAALSTKGTKFEVSHNENTEQFTLNLPGKFNVYNALAAISVGYNLGLTPEKVNNGLEAIKSIPGRFERVEAGQNFSVIVDYAHMPEAFDKFFESIKPLAEGKIIAVFGGMPLHDYVGLGKSAGKWADVVVVADDEPMQEDPDVIRARVLDAVQSGGNAEALEQADREEAIKQAFAIAKKGDVVALLGLGNQQYRRVKGGRVPWDERQIARKLLQQLYAKS